MYKIPGEDKRITQTNRSSVLGTLSSSFNLDLQRNQGVISVSPRLKLNTTGLAGCPVAARNFDGKTYMIAGTKIYVNSGTIETAFTEDASTGVQTDYSSDESDMELFAEELVTTTTDAVYSKAQDGSGSGAWTVRDTLTTGTPHLITYFKRYNRLYYTDLLDNIISIDSSWTAADPSGNVYAISLTAEGTYAGSQTITSLKSTSNSIWIGTFDFRNKGGIGRILEWNGLSNQVSNEYKLQANGCLAIAIDQERDVPYAMDSNGILLRYNGAGFSEVGRLPVKDKLLTNSNSLDNNRFIHPNGLKVTDKGTILAFVNGLNADGSVNEAFQAGIYEFDGKGSCIHRQTPSLYSSSITDHGQSRLSRAGMLEYINVYSTSATKNGTYLTGATYFTSATATNHGVFYDDTNDTVQKYGYFVTSWIHSQNLKDMWQKIAAKYRKFLDASDKIVLKYRTTEADPSSDLTISWNNNLTTFQTSATMTSWAVGDEVEVVQGPGSGKCAHITSKTDLGGGVTEVTLDESFTGVTSTDTAKIRIQKWVKITSISNQTSESNMTTLGKASERIQMKVCMQFTGKDELHELIIINKTHQPLT